MAVESKSALVLALVIVVALGVEANPIADMLEQISGTGQWNYEFKPEDKNCQSVSIKQDQNHPARITKLIAKSLMTRVYEPELPLQDKQSELVKLVSRCQQCCKQHDHIKPVYFLQQVDKLLECHCKLDAQDAGLDRDWHEIPSSLDRADIDRFFEAIRKEKEENCHSVAIADDHKGPVTERDRKVMANLIAYSLFTSMYEPDANLEAKQSEMVELATGCQQCCKKHGRINTDYYLLQEDGLLECHCERDVSYARVETVWYEIPASSDKEDFDRAYVEVLRKAIAKLA